MMQVRKITKNHYEISNDFVDADIKMNPRDSMVMINIEHAKDEAELNLFIEYLKNEVGGKMFVTIPEGMETTEINDQSHTMFITLENLVLAMDGLSEKTKVTNHFSKIKAGEYQLLQTEEDYKKHYQALFEFKKIHGNSFVTPAKLAAGLYSAHAEEEKVKNEFVREFTIYDKTGKQIIATVQAFIHDDLVYLSDFIIHKDKRNQGLAQAIMYAAFKELSNEYKNIKGAWFISGGDGQSPIGKHMYGNILKSEPLDASLQQKLNVRTIYGAPKKLLLTAANRSLHEPNNTLDKIQSYFKNGMKLFTAAVGATAVGAIVYDKVFKNRM